MFNIGKYYLVQRAAFYLHGHAKIPLMLLSIDVVEEVDGVFDNTVTYIAVVASGL